jgi:hypothetical protein
MTVPDFELRGSLRARRLTSHRPPETQVDGEAVTLDRREARVGLPPRMKPGERYADVAVDRRVLGELKSDR